MRTLAKVTARDGLLLHRKPDVDSERIELMPLGARVEIIDEKSPYWPHVEWRSPELGLVRGYAHERWLQVDAIVPPRVDPPQPWLPPGWPLALAGGVLAFVFLITLLWS